MNIFAHYEQQTTALARAEACESIMTRLRTLITIRQETEPLVDIVLLSHLANVSTDCGAIVMLAFDHKSSRFVVVKEYLHEEGPWNLPQHVIRQLQTSVKLYELQARPRCLQPCIDVHISENVTHMIFPYYPLTFDALFGLNRKPPAAFVFEKAIELLHAVQILHESEVAHRDIKAANICFDKRGRLVLIDFDSSVAENLQSRKTVPVCTEQTRAPEQIRAELVETKTGYDAKAGDWWAAGCVIAQMYLGIPLFRTHKFLKDYYQDICMFCAQLAQWKNSIHEKVKALRRCVSSEVMVLLCGILSLDPTKRHSHVLRFLSTQDTNVCD